MIPFQKIIAWFLIGLLSFEVIFRIPFIISDVSALESNDHEDIVSLLVEEEIFRKMSSDIDVYARRIQEKLPHTRTVILTFAKDANPYLIATANEKLYFSGLPDHGKKTQKLVGTILIGHVPLPVVHKDKTDFLSLFPYTDFDEPHFFWNWNSSRYEYLNQSKKDPRADIWHSVIDPNTGDIDSDVGKIRDFFTRVYEYDEKKGRYQNIGEDPQVFYMDSVNESRAASKGLLSVYEQFFLPNQEHLIYNRFSREFSQYLYTGFLSLMKSKGSLQMPAFRDWKPDPNSGVSFLNQASDITTKVFSDELITPFIKVINEKYLEDVSRWIHNTGRYYNGGTDVRFDTIPELITTKDDLSAQVLKEGNDALEKLIDTYVEGNLSMDIPILISRPFQKTVTERDGRRQVTRTYNFVYDNYFYGAKANTIKSAADCSLIRGSTFGGLNTTVEANHGYNMLGGQDDGEIIARDTAAGIACTSPTQSYWGGNSPLNSTYRGDELVLETHRSDDFTLPILDLGAGKKTIGTNSPLDCLRSDLILRPYQHVGISNRKYNWPVETNGNRYSCATPLQSNTPNPIDIDPTPERNENILSSLVACSVTDGNITLLDRDGKNLGLCRANGLSGTYKRVSSLIKHSDPTTSVFGKQSQGSSTPNLPIDEERYLLYLNRSGAQARVNYPNLFDVVIAPSDTDEDIVVKIRTVLNSAQSHLVGPTLLPAGHKWSQLIPSGAMGSVNIADTLLANNDIKNTIIEALRWKQLDIETKYISVFERALAPTVDNNNLTLPDKKNLYEISYLGGQGDARNFVFGFAPDKKNILPEWFTDIESTHIRDNASVNISLPDENDSPYTLSSQEIKNLLGESPATPPESQQQNNSEQGGSGSTPKLDCQLLSSVIVWEWLLQLLCWLQDFKNIKSYTVTANPTDFPPFPFSGGFGNFSGLLQQLKSFVQSDSNKNNIQDYVEQNKDKISLNISTSARTLKPRESLQIDTTLDENNYRLDDDTTRVGLEIVRIDDLDEVKSYSAQDSDWDTIQKRYLNISGSDIFRDGQASWSLTSENSNRARITFVSHIYDEEGVLISSEQNSVLVGPISLGVTVVGSSGTSTSHTITAGDTGGVEAILSGLDTYPDTVDVSIRDYVTGQERGTYKAVPVSNGTIRLGSPAIDSVLKKSGRYALTIVAGDYSGQTYFTIAPDEAKTISLSLPDILISEIPQNIPLSLQDAWGNTLDIKGWKLEIKSSDKIKISPLSLQSNTNFTGNAQNSLTITPLSAGNVTLDITLSKDSQKISRTLSRPVLSDIRLVADIPNRNTLEVGQEVPVNFTVQRLDGSIVDSWNMPIKISLRGGDAKLVEETLIFAGGNAKGVIKTGTKPATVSFYLKDAGLGKIVGDSFDILPGAPTRIALTSPEILFAQTGVRGILTTRVYDAFDNLTTLHGYSLIAISDAPNLIQPLVSPRETTTGTYDMDIISLGNPGRILFRAWLQKEGKKSSISTLENVSETNALPVITSEEASKNNWQNIVQVLLGAAFGQTPVKGYFGGSTLFAPQTKTLALSTLLDTPEKPVVTVMPTGNILLGSIQNGTGVKVQVESYLNNILSLSVSDTRLGRLARIMYPVMSDVSTTPCETLCKKDTISFTPAGSDIYYKEGVVYKNSERLFAIAEIFNSPNLSFAFVQKNTQSLQFSVLNNGVNLGTLSLTWKPQVPQKIGKDTANAIQVEPFLPTLLTKLSWSNMSSYETPGMTIYSVGVSRDYLGGAHDQGWSSYSAKSGLGWTEKNTSLLEFASGQEWSESIRNHADYLTINLGDPIIHLPNYAVNSVTGFDKTIGEPVYIGTTDVSDFTFRDSNSDTKPDLIVYHDNGTVGMGLSRSDGAILDAGDLLSIRNSQTGMIRSGDFVGDGYADVVFVDKSGQLHYIVHDENGPTEKPIKYDKIPLLGKVEQLEVFDMDHDDIDDIVVMDHLGSLFIFYGHDSGIFRVQLLDNVYDFVLSSEAKNSYFTGAIRYDGSGFVDPDKMPKAATSELQSKQEQANNILFTRIEIGSQQITTTSIAPPRSLGTAVAESFAGNSTNSLAGLPNGLLRMYDGNAVTLANSIRTGYDAFESENDSIVSSVTSTTTQIRTYLNLLKAPFIVPSSLSVMKQYRSLEPSGQVLSGSPIEVIITLKNNSRQNISNIVLLEKFAEYLSVGEMKYDLVRGEKNETQKFIAHNSQRDAGIADLRNVSISPGETIKLIYNGTLKSFSFGKFDVGYLEDSEDPTSENTISQSDIRTINPVGLDKDSIPENEFYNHDSYGDIRFNPNETCGGPILLWRSHNIYDRTYHKTAIVRDVVDPYANAVGLSRDPTQASDISRPVQELTELQVAERAQAQFSEWQKDSDGDQIPDKDDNDFGEVFQMVMKNNIPQILMSLGSMDSIVGSITNGVNQVLSSLGSGFAGCMAQPINWSPNMPGNTITSLGYPTPGANTPPKACHRDVNCGVSAFAYPTGSRRNSTWPPTPLGSGGRNDRPSGVASSVSRYGPNDDPDSTGSSKPLAAGTYVPGLGISKFRLFLDKTLTGAVTQLTCFGANNAITNTPGMFPLQYSGNCIYAVQQLLQCLPDGSKDKPLNNENDVSDTLSPSRENDNPIEEREKTNVFSNASSCSFFDPIDSYPADLSQTASNYFAQRNDKNTSELLEAIAQNPEVASGSSSSDTALQFLSQYGKSILQMALNPQAINPLVSQLGNPEAINLESVKSFPNYIMDWYQRQMDEIISSLTQFPDLQLALPNLSFLGDAGLVPSLTSGMQQGATGISSSQTSSLLSSIFPTADAQSASTNSSSMDGGVPPRVFAGANQEAIYALPITINPQPKSIEADIPYADGPDIQKKLLEWQKALSAPQSAVNKSRLQQNIQRLKEYQELPERLQEAYYEKEKHLYNLSQNVKGTQEFMGDWMAENGPKYNDWTESFVYNTKMLGSWQTLIDVFNDYETECGVNRNERWNLQHWMSIVIPEVVPSMPIIEMPRFLDSKVDYSDIDTSIDAEIPDYNFTFQPVTLPDAPIGLTAEPMPLIPKIPNLSAGIAPPSVDIPHLPGLPPAAKMPSISPALAEAVGIFETTTDYQCLYRKVPIVPEWNAGTTVAHKTERRGYNPKFDFDDRDLGFLEKYKRYERFSGDIAEMKALSVRTVIDSGEEFQPIENSTQRLEDTLYVNTGIYDKNLAQLPSMIGRLLAATNNPRLVTPQEGMLELSQLIQTIDMSPERRTQFAQLFDRKGYQKNTTSPTLLTQMNVRFNLIDEAIQKDRTKNNGLIQDIVAWRDSSKKLEEIPSLAQYISGKPQLAQSAGAGSYLFGLDPSVLAPFSTLAPLSITTTNPVRPSESTTFEFGDDQGLQKTQGLYVTQGETTQKLIDFSEGVDGESKLHTIDDDKDGDLDLYYSIGNIIYRKENYTKNANPYVIKDAPKVYSTGDIYDKFFNIKNPDISLLPRNGQINIHQSDVPASVRYQAFMSKGNEHLRLSLFRSLFETQQNKARYQVDIVPRTQNNSSLPVLDVPYIEDIDGTVFIEHNRVYRTLLAKGKYIDQDGSIQDLSSEFVIRGGQSGYTSEPTTLEVTSQGKTVSYKMTTGQRVKFTNDSRVTVFRGSLILFDSVREKRPMSVRDIRLPILPEDRLITDKNSNATIVFPDGKETFVGPSQYWSLAEYAPGVGVKKLSLPVESEWYYGTLTDTRTLAENRFPHAVVFDAYADFFQGSILSQIPSQIKLSLPSPTEIDFQSYFPADTITNVEIFRLPSSQYRQISPTRVAFETQRESREMVVRVTFSGKIRDYVTKIVTDPPKLSIRTLDASGKISGQTISVSPLLPLGIQSYIDDQNWTLARGFSSNNNTFASSIERNNPLISLGYNAAALATFNRKTGVPILGNSFSLVPLVSLGKTFSYSVLQGGAERLRVEYDFPETIFRQVATIDEINKPGIFILGSGLRLESTTLKDSLKGGAYITDINYKPLITLDSRGFIRTLDTNISWSVKTENNYISFVISRDRVELGRIVLNGDIITTFDSQN